MKDLYRPRLLPDLLIAALDRSGDRPCLYIDDDALTAAQLRDEISRYVQAFHSQGIVCGDGVATLSKNRPEVLCSMGAVMVGGCRNTPLHPLGSLDDHAYVLEDAGIETMIFDPSFAERAEQLRERVPGLKRLLSYGEAKVGVDLVALAATFDPQRLVGPPVDAEDVSALAYTGGTTGKAKGVMNTYRASAAMAQIMVSEWQWPEEVRHLVCTPLSHAGSSLIVPLLLRGGSMRVLPAFEAGSVLDAIAHHRITTMMLVPSMIYALLDHPRFGQTDLSSLQTIYYGASPMSPTRLQEAIRNWVRSSSSSTDRRSVPRRCASYARRSTIPTTWIGSLRAAAPCRGSASPCSATTATRSRGAAGGAVRQGPARDEGLLEQARRDGPGARGRLVAHRRRRPGG